MTPVLVAAYLFPPYGGGSVVRIHSFIKYLPHFGVKPVVLTIRPEYYPSTYRDEALLAQYDPAVEIVRTKSLEPVAGNLRDKIYGVQKRSRLDKALLSVIKKALNPFFVPDRHVLWLPYAVREGVRLVRERNLRAVVSTAPPFTTHLVAYGIAKRTGLPLILDYRDDWIGNEYYEGRHRIRNLIERRMESRIVQRATRVLCASPESVALFRTKYPSMPVGKFMHLSNGYDPELFENMAPMKASGVVRFVHTGSLTPDRTPEYFLRAVKELFEAQPELRAAVRVTFVGYVPLQHEELVVSLGLQDVVEFIRNVPQQEVARILGEDTGVCLIFQRQSEGGNTAIPGKLYEYIACRKPILCMADGGATVRFLDEMGGGLITSYEDVPGIREAVRTIVLDYPQVAAQHAWPDETVRRYSRKEQARSLAALIEELTAQPAAEAPPVGPSVARRS